MRPRLILTKWQRELVAAQFGMSEDEVQVFLEPILRVDPYAECHCPAIPWSPHRHRFVLGRPIRNTMRVGSA